jgi:hypothetical protein
MLQAAPQDASALKEQLTAAVADRNYALVGILAPQLQKLEDEEKERARIASVGLQLKAAVGSQLDRLTTQPPRGNVLARLSNASSAAAAATSQTKCVHVMRCDMLCEYDQKDGCCTYCGQRDPSRPIPQRRLEVHCAFCKNFYHVDATHCPCGKSPTWPDRVHMNRFWNAMDNLLAVGQHAGWSKGLCAGHLPHIQRFRTPTPEFCTFLTRFAAERLALNGGSVSRSSVLLILTIMMEAWTRSNTLTPSTMSTFLLTDGFKMGFNNSVFSFSSTSVMDKQQSFFYVKNKDKAAAAVPVESATCSASSAPAALSRTRA